MRSRGPGRRRRRAALLVGLALALWGTARARAAGLEVTVVTRDAAGAWKPVAGARVAVRPAGAAADGERALALSSRETDAAGRVTVPWEGGAALVLAGIPGRGMGVTRVPAGTRTVRVALPPEARIEGRVLDPRGRPVPAAEIVVAAGTADEGGPFPAPGTVYVRTLSDGRGRFAVDRLARGRSYRLRVRARGLAAAFREVAAGGGPPLEIRLARGARVRGRVVAVPGGKPVAGALVTVGDVSARTGEDGGFDLRGITPGRHRLRVAAAGRVHVERKDLVLGEGDRREGLVVRVLGTARIRGRVLDPSTRPAAGAELFLRYPGDPSLADVLPPDRLVRAGVTDGEGRFDVRGLPPAQGVDLIVRHPGYAPVVHLGYGLFPGGTVEIVVLLRRGGTLAGRVQDAEGKAVAGARIVVLNARVDPADLLARPGFRRPTAREGRTGADGAFRVEHVPAGRRQVVVLGEGRVAAVLRGVEVAEGEVRDGLLLVPGGGKRMEGRVLGPGGEPLPGAEVSIRSPLVPSRKTRTDGEGRFAFRGLPSVAWRVTAHAEGYGRAVREGVKVPVTDLTLEIPPAAGITGRVVLGAGEDPVPGPRVRVLVRESPSPLAPDRNRYREVARARGGTPDGRFAFPLLEPGSYRIEAWTEGGLYGFRDRVVVAPGAPAPPVTVRVLPGWTITGRVVRARDGRPVEGARVAVRGPADRPGPHRTRTDERGAFTLGGVPAGFHRLRVAARGLAPAETAPVLVRAAAVTAVGDIALAEGARVWGVVTGSGGSPVSGVRISLDPAGGGESRRAVTDANGTFLFEHVARGSHLLAAETSSLSGGTTRDERLIRVEGDEDLFFELGAGSGASLAGRVTSPGGPVARVPISVLPLEGELGVRRRILSTLTGENGEYVLPGLEPGECLLSVGPLPGGGPPVRFPVFVFPGPVTIFDPVLPSSGVAGRVENLDTGEPLEGVRLVLTRLSAGAGETFLDRLAAQAGETRSGGDGGFRFPAVPPGTYRLEAYREGFGQTRVEELAVGAGGLPAVRVAMPPAGEVEVTVTDRRYVPLSSAEVSFRDGRGRPATRPAWLAVDAEGRLRMRRLRTGIYRVLARAPGHAVGVREAVSVFPGGRPEVRLALAREGRLVVTVYGPGALPLEGARVEVRDFWGGVVAFPEPPVGLRVPWRDPARTDEKGRVGLGGLPAGIYSVSAFLPGFRGEPVRIRVLDGEVSRAAVVLLGD